MRNSELLNALVREIQSHGVDDYQVEHGKHRKLIFAFQGRAITFVFPSSPSDWRGERNAISTLRRVMGVQRQITKSESNTDHRRPRKPVAAQSVALSPPTNLIFSEGFEKLATLGHCRRQQRTWSGKSSRIKRTTCHGAEGRDRPRPLRALSGRGIF